MVMTALHLYYIQLYNNKKFPKFKPIQSQMNSSTIPHPPNSSWTPPLDPNDEDTLQQQQAMIEQQFKNILSQDLVSGLGTFETREEEEEEEEEEQGEELEEYTDQIQMPDVEEI